MPINGLMNEEYSFFRRSLWCIVLYNSQNLVSRQREIKMNAHHKETDPKEEKFIHEEYSSVKDTFYHCGQSMGFVKTE